MEVRRLPFAHPDTERFLTEAFKQGAADKVMIQAAKDARLRRSLVAIADYYRNDWSFKRVGTQMVPKTSHETARQEVYRGMNAIWRESPEGVQNAFPFDSLKIVKPVVTGATRPSLVSEGVKVIARAAAEGGDYNKVLEAAGGSSIRVSLAREIARSALGIEIPYKNLSPKEYAELIEACTDPNLPRDKYLRLQSKITLEIAQNMTTKKKGVISLAEAVKRCGYLIKTRALRPVKELFEDDDIVFNRKRTIQSGKNTGLEQTYSFIATRDQDLFAARLASKPEFEPFKIPTIESP